MRWIVEFSVTVLLGMIAVGIGYRVCWLFICGNLPMRTKRSMNQRTKEVITFAFIATLVMIVAVGLGLIIFHFTDTQDLLAQWLRSITM